MTSIHIFKHPYKSLALKEYLLQMNSILMYFVKYQPYFCLVVDGCYAIKLVAKEIVWVLSSSVEWIIVWHRLCNTFWFIKCEIFFLKTHIMWQKFVFLYTIYYKIAYFGCLTNNLYSRVIFIFPSNYIIYP